MCLSASGSRLHRNPGCIVLEHARNCLFDLGSVALAISDMSVFARTEPPLRRILSYYTSWVDSFSSVNHEVPCIRP